MNLERKQWYAVRCCCTPKKIFGFLLLPVHGASAEVIDNVGTRYRLQIRRFNDLVCQRPFAPESVPIGDSAVVEEAAVYSEDKPIEFWRSIPGFVEIK